MRLIKYLRVNRISEISERIKLFRYAKNKTMIAYFAETADPSALALAYDEVISARSFQIRGTTVVAVITVPFYLKSERDAFRSSLAAELGKALQTEVVVTFDTGVYRKIDDGLSDDQKLKLLDAAKAG